MRQRKSCWSSISLGTLKLVTSQPIGLTLRKTFLTVPSLPDASRPWRTTRRAYRPSAYNADCSFLILLLSCLAAFLSSSPLGRPLGRAASASPMRICCAEVMGTSFAASWGTRQRTMGDEFLQNAAATTTDNCPAANGQLPCCERTTALLRTDNYPAANGQLPCCERTTTCCERTTTLLPAT